jgi:hypothetical protein
MKMARKLVISALVLTAGCLGGVASASTQTRGVVTGRVIECAPGPIVASPTPPRRQPTPARVTIRHDGTDVGAVSIVFTTSTPWSGGFSFSVPPGRYEVTSSYLHQVAWVHVRADATSVVHFGPFACPLETAR